jgi:hypothetical protein
MAEPMVARAKLNDAEPFSCCLCHEFEIVGCGDMKGTKYSNDIRKVN